MQSEIPQIQVVTAIAEAEAEDYLSQLLFSQGWSIVFRAFDFDGLSNFLTERGTTARTVLIFKSDLPGLNSKLLSHFESPSTTLINIDGIPSNAHLLMTHIRSQLRLPLLVNHATQVTLARNQMEEDDFEGGNLALANKREFGSGRQLQKIKNIAITGTTGAPGRSSLTLNIANYASAFSRVSVIDADVRSQAIEYLFGRSEIKNPSLEFGKIDPAQKPTSLLPELLTDQSIFSQVTRSTNLKIFDIGALPPLEEVVNDRRWQAGLINSILEQTTTLIYICKSTGLSLIRLEAFMNQFPILIRKLPIIYVLNQSGSTREDRALEKRFRAMVTGEVNFVLPLESKINRVLSTPGKRNSPFTKEIGKIVAELK